MSCDAAHVQSPGPHQCMHVNQAVDKSSKGRCWPPSTSTYNIKTHTQLPPVHTHTPGSSCRSCHLTSCWSAEGPAPAAAPLGGRHTAPPAAGGTSHAQTGWHGAHTWQHKWEHTSMDQGRQQTVLGLTCVQPGVWLRPQGCRHHVQCWQLLPQRGFGARQLTAAAWHTCQNPPQVSSGCPEALPADTFQPCCEKPSPDTCCSQGARNIPCSTHTHIPEGQL
jgi:hypothetical protein